MKKKIWIFVVPVLLFVMSVVLLSFRTEAFAEPNLRTSAYFSGAGTEESPYIISNVDHFIHLSADVGAGIDYDGEYFILDGDIDLRDKLSFQSEMKKILSVAHLTDLDTQFQTSLLTEQTLKNLVCSERAKMQR